MDNGASSYRRYLNGDNEGIADIVREAAAILKKNDRRMKNLLYRAKQSLKSELEKDGFTYEEL